MDHLPIKHGGLMRRKVQAVSGRGADAPLTSRGPGNSPGSSGKDSDILTEDGLGKHAPGQSRRQWAAAGIAGTDKENHQTGEPFEGGIGHDSGTEHLKIVLPHFNN